MKKSASLVILTIIFLSALMSGCTVGKANAYKPQADGISAKVTEVGYASIFENAIETNKYPYAYRVELSDAEGRALDGLKEKKSIFLPVEALPGVDMATVKVVLVNSDGSEQEVPSHYLIDRFMMEVKTSAPGLYAISTKGVKFPENASFTNKKVFQALAARGVIDAKANGRAIVKQSEFLDMIKDMFIEENLAFTKSGKKLTREDMAFMLFNLSEQLLGKRLESDDGSKIDILDKDKISKGKYDACILMAGKKLIMLKLDKFMPKEEVTLEQACEVLYKYYNQTMDSTPRFEIKQEGAEGGNANGVKAYPAVYEATPSNSFSLTANGLPIFTEHFYHESVARFEITGKTEIKLTTKDYIKGMLVSPRSLGIVPEIRDNTAVFTLDKPQKLILQFGNMERLIILAEAPENAPFDTSGENTINIADMGADKTGKTDCTEIIQSALDKGSQSGKTVVFPNGKYLTKSIYVKSNTNVYIAPSAVIFAGYEGSEYARQEDPIPNMSYIQSNEVPEIKGRAKTDSVVYIKDAENVNIYGRGMIDGYGINKWCDRWSSKGGNMDYPWIHNLITYDSKNVTVEGIISRFPGSWNFRPMRSENVTLKNVKAIGNLSYVGCDGIDIDWCRNTLVEDCLTYTNDDAICLKQQGGYGQKTEVFSDFIARNNVIFTFASGMVLGNGINGAEMKNVLYENNDIVSADRVISSRNFDWAIVHNINFVNNRADRIYNDPRNSGHSTWLELENRDDMDRNTPERAFAKTYNVNIRNLRVLADGQNPIRLLGENSVKTITDILCENVVIGGVRLREQSQLRVSKNDFSELPEIK